MGESSSREVGYEYLKHGLKQNFIEISLLVFFFGFFCVFSRYLAKDDGKLKKGLVENAMFSWNVLRLTDAGNKKEYGGTKIDAEAGCAISLTYGRNKHLGMHSSGVVLFFFFSPFSQQPYPPFQKHVGHQTYQVSLFIHQFFFLRAVPTIWQSRWLQRFPKVFHLPSSRLAVIAMAAATSLRSVLGGSKDEKKIARLLSFVMSLFFLTQSGFMSAHPA